MSNDRAAVTILHLTPKCLRWFGHWVNLGHFFLSPPQSPLSTIQIKEVCAKPNISEARASLGGRFWQRLDSSLPHHGACCLSCHTWRLFSQETLLFRHLWYFSCLAAHLFCHTKSGPQTKNYAWLLSQEICLNSIFQICPLMTFSRKISAKTSNCQETLRWESQLSRGSLNEYSPHTRISNFFRRFWFSSL